MSYQDIIEQAIQRQLEVEHKARAWDTLMAEAAKTPGLPEVLTALLERTRGQG